MPNVFLSCKKIFYIFVVNDLEIYTNLVSNFLLMNLLFCLMITIKKNAYTVVKLIYLLFINLIRL